MKWFQKKAVPSLDPDLEPVLLVSICTGETTAAFRNIKTGKTTGICLIRSEADLDDFRKTYGITGEIRRVY